MQPGERELRLRFHARGGQHPEPVFPRMSRQCPQEGTLADPGSPIIAMACPAIDLTGRTAIVTGASRGIGLAVTRALAGSGGARVIAGA